MWFSLGVQNFIGKKTSNADSCDIFISDFVRIWHKSLSNNELLSISKTLNPLLEASVQKLKEVTLNLLEDVKVLKEVTEDSTNNNVSLKLQSNILGVKFQFQVILQKGCDEMLYKEFTASLLLLLMKFHNQEKKLIKIIQDKDVEIESYKQEYGVKPNYLATEPFNEEEFNQEDSSWSLFLSCITNKIQPAETEVKIKEEEVSPEKNIANDEGNKKKAIFSKQRSGFKPYVLLGNQSIKNRDRHNEFKIKF